jgi:hypothetical protein
MMRAFYAAFGNYRKPRHLALGKLTIADSKVFAEPFLLLGPEVGIGYTLSQNLGFQASYDKWHFHSKEVSQRDR